MVGKNLSHYRILEELGRGGMGIVYKAADTKLDRTVAIKVLPSAALASADDRARFYREAKAAAQLHHPHIASVFEIDEAVPSDAPHGTEPSPFISMEYIEGETLSDRVQRGPLKLDEAVRTASQIASGLEAAHEKNIVHRDLKSQNVMLTSKGEAKVLDFGLAQTAASTKLTRMGSTLGTVAYMSPEQARGEEVDRRTDIWSLGVVLYEMITGRSPFPGEYDKAVVYSILNEDPEPPTALRTGVPMELERITSKCMSKEASRRYQSATDLIVDLRNVSLDSISSSRYSSGLSASAISQPRVHMRSWVVSGMVFALTLFVGLLIGRIVFPAGSEKTDSLTRSSIMLPEEYPLALIGAAPFNTGRKSFDLARDGSRIAYAAQLADGSTKIAVRDLASDEITVLDGTDGAYSPFFSPDAEQIGFYADTQMKVVSLSGGTPRVLADVRLPTEAVWHASGDIYFVDHEAGPLTRVSPQTGNKSILLAEGRNRNPAPIADTNYLLLLHKDTLSVISLEDGSLTNLEIGGSWGSISTPSYSSSGHLLYTIGSDLLAVEFDKRSHEVLGAPFIAQSGIRQEALSFMGQYSISHTGLLAYAPGGDVRVVELLKVDQQGTVLDIISEPQIFGELSLSPDGASIAVPVLSNKWDIWIYDTEGILPPQRLTFDGTNYNPVWSADGSTIYFESNFEGPWYIYSKDVSSSGNLVRLEYEPRDDLSSHLAPESFSSDGSTLLLSYGSADLQGEIQAINLTNLEFLANIGSSPFDDWGSSFSPDGSQVVFHSSEAGTPSVYLTSVDTGAPRIRISAPETMDPRWSHDGQYVYFHDVKNYYRVRIPKPGDTSRPEQELVFSGDFVDLGGIGWAVDTENEVFYVARSMERESVAPALRLVSNLGALIRQADPANR